MKILQKLLQLLKPETREQKAAKMGCEIVTHEDGNGNIITIVRNTKSSRSSSHSLSSLGHRWAQDEEGSVTYIK